MKVHQPEKSMKERIQEFDDLLLHSENKKFNPSVGIEEMESSLGKLSAFRSSCLAAISSLNQAQYQAEKGRVSIQQEKMEGLKKQLVEERKLSKQRMGAIDMKWGRIYQENDPMKLESLLNEQKKSCNEIIKSKSDLIEDLKSLVRNQDSNYLESLGNQSRSIDLLCSKMREQMEEFKDLYKKLFEKLNVYFEEKRKKKIRKQHQQVENILNKRRDLEISYLELRKKKMDEYEEQLEQIINTELEHFAITKKEKDEKCHELEQSMDIMRGKYELNAEKLKYYFDILQDRIKEKKKVYVTNQAEIAKLIDQLIDTKGKYQKMDKEFQQKNLKTTDQYNRLAKQYKDLIKKFKYYEKSDTQIFNNVWEMNEKAIKDMLDRLFEVDEYLTTKILGNEYKPPNIVIKPIPGSEEQLDSLEQKDREKEKKRTILNAKEFSAAKVILKRLSESTTFLIPSQKKEIFNEENNNTPKKQNKNKEENMVLQLNKILKIMGLEGSTTIDKLIQFFIERHPEVFSENRMSSVKEDKIYIPEKDLISTLTEFIRKQKINRNKSEISLILKKKKNQREEREREYWESIENCIDEEKKQLWKLMKKVLKNHGKNLSDREKYKEKNRVIAEENEKLKLLLQQYRKDKINEELYLPPKIV